MKSNLLILSGILLLSISGFSQENISDTLPTKIRESAIYGSAGGGPIVLSVNLNYELLFKENPEKKLRKQGIRTATGLWLIWEDFGYFILADYVWLTGAGNQHFEWGLGASYYQELSGDEWLVLPAGYIAYRYQKPQGRLIFRSGIGFPDGLFLCFGYAF